MHQGDQAGQKGVYHINTVDEITQFEFIGAVESISQHSLTPVLLKLIESYPFLIREFHADNGSEYVNRIVVKLLNKLLITLTKSRPRQVNDNALVEREKRLGAGEMGRLPVYPPETGGPGQGGSTSAVSTNMSTSTGPAASPPKGWMPKAG